MGMADNNGNDTHPTAAEGNANNILVPWAVLYALLGVVSAISGILKFPNGFKLLVLCFVALFWGFFEFNKRVHNTTLDLVWKRIQQRQGVPSDTERESQTPGVRWGVGGLLLLFLLGWGYEKLNERTVAETIYYMVVLDASDAMKEPFDIYPSKWVAVREAFQEFYDGSHPDSNYGLVLIGGQNPQEGTGIPCSLPRFPLIPVVSKNGHVLPHRKLTLPKLQDEVEGQQPQGGGSLNRAFFLAKNHLESLKLDEPISSMVIVLIANASDSCDGKIDWDTLASEIELANENIAIRKELILLDVEASQEVTAFADKMNAMDEAAGTSNTFVQVVQTYDQLVMSISFVMERNEAAQVALETATTATAQSEQGPIPHTGGQGSATLMTVTPEPRRVVVAASATSTPTLTPTATSTLTPTLTFTPTVTSTLTRTKTPTLTPINTPLPTWTVSKPGGGGGGGSSGGGGGGSGFDKNGDGKVTCKDFSTQSEALVALNAGYTNLDSDRDGIPCENLPP